MKILLKTTFTLHLLCILGLKIGLKLMFSIFDMVTGFTYLSFDIHFLSFIKCKTLNHIKKVFIFHCFISVWIDTECDMTI